METVSKEFWDDQQWGFKHHADLLQRFKDKWIAIFNKKVVCSGTDLSKVTEDAKKITGKKETPVMFVECGAHLY
ncbi:hypothetical protein HY484_00315 [Candidatus Woesearchaeota archaeon]|nr:hypothetical protein [Candidatus Woesearchaeota archaeon]